MNGTDGSQKKTTDAGRDADNTEPHTLLVGSKLV